MKEEKAAAQMQYQEDDGKVLPDGTPGYRQW
jgi:hypothetical protein